MGLKGKQPLQRRRQRHHKQTHHHTNTTNTTTVAKKVPVKGVSAFAVAPVAGRHLLAAFVPEAKGQPAAACVVDAGGAEPVTVSRRSFYRATGAQMLWNATATACLFLATSDTDATNQVRDALRAVRMRCESAWSVHRRANRSTQ